MGDRFHRLDKLRSHLERNLHLFACASERLVHWHSFGCFQSLKLMYVAQAARIRGEFDKNKNVVCPVLEPEAGMPRICSALWKFGKRWFAHYKTMQLLPFLS